MNHNDLRCDIWAAALGKIFPEVFFFLHFSSDTQGEHSHLGRQFKEATLTVFGRLLVKEGSE